MFPYVSTPEFKIGRKKKEKKIKKSLALGSSLEVFI